MNGNTIRWAHWERFIWGHEFIKGTSFSVYVEFITPSAYINKTAKEFFLLSWANQLITVNQLQSQVTGYKIFRKPRGCWKELQTLAIKNISISFNMKRSWLSIPNEKATCLFQSWYNFSYIFHTHFYSMYCIVLFCLNVNLTFFLFAV